VVVAADRGPTVLVVRAAVVVRDDPLARWADPSAQGADVRVAAAAAREPRQQILTWEGTMTDSFKLKLHIPDKQPFEGKATQKQKQYIWDLGYRDEDIIAGLGKKQASAVIDQLSRSQRYLWQKKRGRTVQIVGAAMLAAGSGFIWIGKSEGYTGLGVALVIMGVLTALYGLVKWLFYYFLAPKPAGE
jgi:hypothetical protein